jgi:hypothetical protein
METMTLMPNAAQVLDGRALPTMRASWTSGIGMTGHASIVNVTCSAAVASPSRHFGTKAYGTRRLGEHAST